MPNFVPGREELYGVDNFDHSCRRISPGSCLLFEVSSRIRKTQSTEYLPADQRPGSQ